MSQTTNDTALGGAFGGEDEGLVQTNPEVEASQNPTTTKTITDESALGGSFGSEESPLVQSLSSEAQDSADAAQASEEAALQSATNAANSANSASTSATNAAASESNAATSATSAATSAASAATSETNAATSATSAATSATQAALSETNALVSENSAALSEVNANQSAIDAESSATSATSSALSAQSSATSASSSASSAATSATNAATSEVNAAVSANQAALSESNAATSETNAANSASTANASATTATTKATEASTSATNAALSETNAATSETNAATSETNAAASAASATTSETNASASATSAATSETNAATSETNAALSEANAATSETNASASATAAATSETNASSSATAAATSETNAATSETNAADSATAASTSEVNAATSETNAATSETNAATSATGAATSATNAATSASEAATSEANALIYKNAAQLSNQEAETAKIAAETAETNAATSATNAATSEANAATSATNAATSETNAANSATAASASETNAASSASDADTSASNAAASATQASTSATNAATSATSAATSATNAATSEANAATSEANAATSATNAATSATSASTSAGTATTKASEAATSAANASASATSASSSATSASASASNALVSANQAATTLDNFEDIYLGAKASDPTLDNDGDALQVGALYFNTTDGDLRIWEGSVWTNVVVSADIQNQIDTSIANLVDSAPSALNTLNELAAALGDDPNFATTINNSIASLQNQITTIDTNKYEYNDDAVFNSVGFTNANSGEGVLTWNNTNGTMNLTMGNGVVQQVGEELYYPKKTRNMTGAAIPNGTPVMLVGGIGEDSYIAPAIADNSIPHEYYAGLTTEDIPDGSYGRVLFFGSVNDVDTSAYNKGDLLYVSPTVPGEFTTNKPESPNHAILAALVTKVGTTDGRMFVRVHTNPEANEITYDNTLSGLVSSNVKGALDELQQNKASVDLLSSNIVLFPTDSASTEVTGYNKLVINKEDPDYDTVAVNIPTGSIGTTETLVGALASDDGLVEGSIAGITVTLIGNIQKLTGNNNQGASFYFKIYRRESNGTEHEMGESNHTNIIYETTGYEQFSASVYLNDGGLSSFSLTDRFVLKFYAVANATGTSYQFQFGGTSPVRAIVPVPISVVPSRSAAETPVDTSNFNGKLGGTDTNVQAALDTLDDHDHDSEYASLTGYNKSNWDTAYSWGDHSLEGYLTGIPAEYLTQAEGDLRYLSASAETLPDQTGHAGQFLTTNGTTADWATVDTSLGDTAYGWGDHALVGYLTSETDPTVPSHVKSITTTDISQWDTAYGWGNHASAGYLTSIPSSYLTTSTGVQQLSLGTSPNYQTPSSRRVDPNASNPTNEHYAVMTYGNGGNVTGQLATHFQSGATYNRAYNNSWSAWSRMFDDDYHPEADYATSAGNADTVDSLHASSFIRSDANDTFTGNLTTGADNHITFGPNSTWGSSLRVGGNGRTATGTEMASVVTTDGNLHLDAADSTNAIYLGYYAGSGGTIFGSGSGSIVARMDTAGNLYKATSSTNSTATYWHSANDGSGSGLDADLLDGQHASAFAPASHSHNYISEGGTSFSGEYPVAVRVSANNFYSDNNIRFEGATSKLTVDGSIVTGTGSFSGKVDFQGDAAIEGGSGYGIFKGYTTNNNHMIVVRGAVTGSGSSPTIVGDHQTTFVEFMNPRDETSGWFFKDSYTSGAYTYSEIARITTTGVHHGSSMRAPIFYDSDDTGRYLDPASTSRINKVRLYNRLSIGSNSLPYDDTGTGEAGVWLSGSATDPTWFLGLNTASSSAYLRFYAGGDRYTFGRSGDGSATSSWRAPIFYDSNNTGYYGDFANTSLLYRLELNNKLDFRAQTGTWIESNVMTDAIGWNTNYGVYIGSNVGGTHYLRGNGTFTTGGNTYDLIHTGNVGSQSVAYAQNANNLDGLNSTAYMRDDGWNTSPGQDANTQSQMKSDFSYSNNAPYTGELVRFGAGGYSLQFSSAYQYSGRLAFRTYNNDSAKTWNAWAYPAIYNHNSNGGGNLYANVYYDSNNTGYYTDPNSVSRMLHLSLGDVYDDNDGGWNARLNVRGSLHARLDVASNSDGIITSVYSHTGQAQGRIGTLSNHTLGLMANGSVYATLSTGGVFSVYNGYQVNGSTVIDSSRNFNGAKAYFSGTGTGTLPTLDIVNTSATTFNHSAEIIAPNMTTGQHNIVVIGKASNTKNAGYIGYLYSGTSGSNSNKITLGHWGNDDLVTIDGLGNTNINEGSLQIAGTTVIDSSRNLTNIGHFQNGSMWVNDGSDYNSYNENIRLFNGSNNVSVIAFGASGISGRPQSSILGFSDRNETRVGATDNWATRTYQTYFHVNGAVMGSQFTDGNDSNWYVDPTGDTRINDLYPDRISCRQNGNQGTPRWDFRAYVVESPHHYSQSSTGAMYVGESNHVYIRSIGEASSDFRAPRFYDSNDTGYYVDPNSNSRIDRIDANEIYNYGWFRNHESGEGMYNQATAQHFYSDNANGWNVAGGGANNWIRFRDSHNGTIRGYVYADNGNNVGFLNSSGSWRARVVGNDYFLVEGSSARAPLFYDSNDTTCYINPQGSSQIKGELNIRENVSASGYTFMRFQAVTTGGTLGSIYRQYGTMVYSTNSDYRLKENVVDLSSATERLRQLQPKRFNFIDYPDVTVDGFIAHEVSDVVPEAVIGEKDAVDKYGNPEHQSLDASKLVPLLTAALQEALDKIESLEARLEVLENS